MAARRKFRKGSKEAKAFMARLRSMKGGRKKAVKHSKKKATKRRGMGVYAVTAELNKLRNKGRRIAHEAGIKPFYFTGKSGEQIIVSEGMEGMAKARKTRKRRATRKHTMHGAVKHTRRRSHRLHGKTRRHRRHSGKFFGGMNVKGITGMVTMGVAGAAGAIGSAYIANLLPASINPKFKPAVPLLLAVVLLTVGKKVPMAKPLAFGAAISGILGLTKQFVPSLPTLAGVESVPELSADEALMLGAPQGFLGDDSLGAVQSFGAMSPADL